MGVTLHYRGSLADLARVEDFEDRVLDLALELGGQARIWRSTSDGEPRRTIRGVTVDLFPGQETTCLLISPEGWLIGLFDLEDAEKGPLDEKPWCFVKTQFGPVEGHVALVEMLAALKREFLPDLEVSDEGGYWETRDLNRLTGKFSLLHAAIEGLAEGLERYGLSPEAAEDPQILVARVERIAQLVQRTLARPAEHPPVHFEDDDLEGEGGAERDESTWDASYKENRRRQEHVHRAIEEHLARGEEIDEAFDAAMREETAAGLPDEPEEESNGWEEACDEEDGESWKESLSESPAEKGDDDVAAFAERPDHPLQRKAMDLMLRLHDLLGDRSDAAGSHQDTLMYGVGEISGGLAQALTWGPSCSSSNEGPAEDGSQPDPADPEESLDDWQPPFGLAVVQLKRAMRGAAFALGALPPLRAAGILDRPAFQEIRDTLRDLQTGILAELRRLRQERGGE